MGVKTKVGTALTATSLEMGRRGICSFAQLVTSGTSRPAKACTSRPADQGRRVCIQQQLDFTFARGERLVGGSQMAEDAQ